MSKSHASIENFRRVRDDLGYILKQLAEIAEKRGDLIVDNQSAAAKIADVGGDFHRSLAEMLNERSLNVMAKEAFRVAVVGRFKSGKSTLINTLLGREVLSTDPLPRTAVKTVLRYGDKDAFRVTYTNGSKSSFIETDRLAKEIEKVTSDDARALIKGKSPIATQIKEVEIWCKADFLNRKETEIVDTPGLGSVHPEHKKVTFSTIPEVDATLFLFPADPGLGEEEKELLEFIQQYINRFLFVMTKIDIQRAWKRVLDYSKCVIQEKAKIPPDRIYGVSSEKQLNFDIFLEGLESFLVSSSGVARLQVPFGVALTQCENLSKNTHLNLHRIDDDVATLRTELQRLKDAQVEIDRGRKMLIFKVEEQMASIMENALDGIDYLPVRVEEAVFTVLDDSNKESLKKADLKIQTIINNTVAEWVETKDRSFKTQAALLQNLVESELQRFVTIVDEATRPNLLDASGVESDSPDVGAVISGRGPRLVLETAAQAAGFLVGGWGAASILYYFTAFAVPLVGVLLLPLIPIIGHFMNDENRIREDIKQQLKADIPGNNIDTFKAIVEGYTESDGSHHAGLRETLESHFNTWGNNLKTEINNFVINLIDNQLTQIENQIHEKETDKFDREQRQKMYSEHGEKLERIGAQLAELGKIIDSMNSSNKEQSSGVDEC